MYLVREDCEERITVVLKKKQLFYSGYKIKQIPKMDILDSRYEKECLYRCFLVFLEYRESKMSIFGICFILYFLKLYACRGFYSGYSTQLF